MNYAPQKKLPNRFALDLGFVRNPTWKERLQLLIGYNLKLDIKLLVDKRSGEVKHDVHLNTTKELVTRTLVGAPPQKSFWAHLFQRRSW